MGAGNPLPIIYVRAAMLARLMTFLQAHSGVNIQVYNLHVEFLNNGIYPVVPEHGSVGASEDLVQILRGYIRILLLHTDTVQEPLMAKHSVY